MASQIPPSGSFANRYTIERELGRGGTATVYLARDETTSTSVALKILRRELVESVAADRFLREFRLNAALRHPHIAPILDSGQFDRDLYLVMPNMENGSLRLRLEKERQLSVDAVVEIVRGIGSALQHAHERGLIHRDVKPENILFSGDQAYLSDFGIARAVERATGDSTTSSGIVRGTPAYMSPEQASGEHHFDGRSDQYSFACVAYEMLAGMPAFHGPTQESTIALRFRVPAREISAYRPGVSPAIERVIQKAMSLSPADRYANMGEFVKAFDAAVLEPAGKIAARTLGTRPRLYRLIAIAATITITAVLSVYGVTRWLTDASVARDSTQIVVLPFETGDSAAEGSEPYELFHAGLRRWIDDLYVVPDDRVFEALKRRRPGGLSPNDMRSIATSLGAGRFVVVKRTRTPSGGDALFAEYRDVATGSLHAAQLDLPSDSTQIESVYSALADSMVLRGASDSGPPRPRGPRHLFATQAFIRAMNARQEWDLDRADSELVRAVSLDPGFSRAYLWLAQQKAWQGHDSQDWVSNAEHALADTTALTERERLMGHALVSLGGGAYPKACGYYRDLIHLDPMNFAGWYGLGECNQRDHVVIRDPHSRSGWRFRSSVQEAVVSYARAFQIIPATYRGFAKNGFKRLRDLLFISGNRWTEGTSLETPARAFWGVPAITGDSMTLVPRLKVDVQSERDNVAPTEVVIHLRAAYDTIVMRWANAFPQSADVKESIATSLELRGDPAAIDTLIVAERLVKEPRERVRLAANRIAVSIKFAAAAFDTAAVARIRQSADSLLSRTRRTPEIAGFLAPIAAMTGQCALASSLLRQSAPAAGSEAQPHDVVADIDSLEAEVSAGCQPADIHRRLDDIASRLVPKPPTEAGRIQTEYWQLNFVVRAIEPLESKWVTRLARAAAGPTIAAERDLLEGRPDSARTRLHALARMREQSVLPGQVTAEAVVPEARVWLMLRDTTAALISLESALNTARLAEPLADDPRHNTARLGFLIQAYALHGLLLARREPARARQSAGVAAAMWMRADEQKQTVARLREILK